MEMSKRNDLFKNWPLVTVYITNRNYGKFIEKSINSVLDQLYTKWELFIIDDAGHSLLENGITAKILEIFSEAEKLYD